MPITEEKLWLLHEISITLEEFESRKPKETVFLL